MSSIFARLNYNFDSSKFGSSLYLTDETKQFINNTPTGLETWQLNDIANGSIELTDYYKNPLINTINSLDSSVNSAISKYSTIEFFDTVDESFNLSSSLANLQSEIVEFRKHTNNVSGVTLVTSTTTENSDTVLDYPSYDTAVNLGQQLLLLVNAHDNVQNSTPILGSMTSLFIEEELILNTINVESVYSTINNSLRLDLDNNVYSNLTSTQAEIILSQLETANSLISTRRNHDWDFYRNGLTIVDDYNKVEKLTRLGNTQTYLVNNLIGTDRYKNNLSANTQ
jgi:hypothetical protein